jgi:hypothetical protein
MNYFILAKIGNVNMKTTFQKTLVAAVVASASLVAHAGGGTPATSNLLFPFISTKDSAQTILSVIARDTTGTKAVGTKIPVHITYMTRPIEAGSCSHFDGDMGMTANDQLTFEISGRTDVNTATGDTTSSPVQLPSIANNRVGFAIVNNNAAGAYGTGAPYGDYPLYGEARVIDTATGLYLGYSTGDLHTLAAGNPDFAVATGQGPDADLTPALYPNKVLNWFSTGAVDTIWHVLPLGTESSMAFTSGKLFAYQVRNSSLTAGGHYNNNEVFRSSTAVLAAQCMTSVARGTLLDPIVATHSANGGWGTFVRLAVLADDGVTDIGAVNTLVHKQEVLKPGVLGGLGQFITRVPVL